MPGNKYKFTYFMLMFPMAVISCFFDRSSVNPHFLSPVGLFILHSFAISANTEIIEAVQ